MITTKLAKQYVTENELQLLNLSLENKIPYIVYYNTNPEVPYLGIQYTDNTYGVIGCKLDCIVASATDMFSILENEYYEQNSKKYL